MFLSISTTAKASELTDLHIGWQCRSRQAPVLCAVKVVHRRTAHWRLIAGNHTRKLKPAIYTTDRAHRIRVLDRWRRRRDRAHAFVDALWSWARQPAVWCVHTNESVDWHEPGSPGGGFQYIYDTWDRAGGQRYAPTAPQATATEQIRVTRHYTSLHGWSEWSTAAECGL
jgi:hypothetical protein